MDRDCEYTDPPPAQIKLNGSTEEGGTRLFKLEDNVTRLLELVEGFRGQGQHSQVSTDIIHCVDRSLLQLPFLLRQTSEQLKLSEPSDRLPMAGPISPLDALAHHASFNKEPSSLTASDYYRSGQDENHWLPSSGPEISFDSPAPHAAISGSTFGGRARTAPAQRTPGIGVDMHILALQQVSVKHALRPKRSDHDGTGNGLTLDGVDGTAKDRQQPATLPRGCTEPPTLMVSSI
jgi:hypothetical protein